MNMDHVQGFPHQMRGECCTQQGCSGENAVQWQQNNSL